MSRKNGWLVIMFLLMRTAGPVQADELHFQTLVVRNDGRINGEFHLSLQVRIAAGVSPRTLGALSCDIHYGRELLEASTDPAVWWTLGQEQGYRVHVSKLPGFYRVLVIDENFNSTNYPSPPIEPVGWNVNNDWQTLVTLRWTIKEVSKIDILIEERTQAAAFTESLNDVPSRLMQNWDVHSFSLGEISLPIELAFLSAEPADGMVLLRWATDSESNNWGFHVFRSEESDRNYQQISQAIIQEPVPSRKHREYFFKDIQVKPDKTYYYKLADVDRNGGVRFHGPVTIKTSGAVDYALEQNYPNPFNGETRINFSVKEPGVVELDVINLQGQLVRTLLQRPIEPGRYLAVWNGRDDAGKPMPSGIYLFQIRVNDYKSLRKMHLVK
jgi:hypothetical protein